MIGFQKRADLHLHQSRIIERQRTGIAHVQIGQLLKSRPGSAPATDTQAEVLHPPHPVLELELAAGGHEAQEGPLERPCAAMNAQTYPAVRAAQVRQPGVAAPAAPSVPGPPSPPSLPTEPSPPLPALPRICPGECAMRYIWPLLQRMVGLSGTKASGARQAI